MSGVFMVSGAFLLGDGPGLLPKWKFYDSLAGKGHFESISPCSPGLWFVLGS